VPVLDYEHRAVNSSRRSGKEADLRSLAEAVVRHVRGLLARRPSPARRRLGLAVALILFVGGAVIGVLSLPHVEQEPRWELLAVVGLVGLPLTLAVNAAEYQVTAAILGYRVPFVVALRIGVLATAANLLPIPGAVLVRAHAIRKLGASYGKIVLSTGAVGICFVGTTCLMAGGVLAASGELAFGGVLLGAGLVLLALALVVLVRERGPRTGVRLLLATAARATGAIVVKAGRLYLVLVAFGYEAGVTQALTLTLAAIIALALGFFPGGLGAAEVLGAALSPLVGLSAAVGFVASAVDRLISILGLAVLAGGVILLDRRRDRSGSRGKQAAPPASGS
jgi:uncharacterized membrane protein YbhN (UPF0104 family)